MNLDERIEDILLAFRTDHISNLPAPRDAIKRIIFRTLQEVKPKSSIVGPNTAETDRDRQARLALKDFEDKVIARIEAKQKELGL